MQNLDLKNIDKASWQTFRFEEIAEKISKTVKPEEADVDIYVGLEHLDAEDIHIKRHGVPSDVKGGKLRCYPGDIIFGKRRAYQRKAAIVDFDGICSAHAFVFRANPDVIEPELFPFFLHSDQFMHRMVDISVGGLSPTINWSDLKHQEFLLPPKDQQKQLAKLLWAMDDVIEKEKEVLERLNSFKLSQLKEVFNRDKCDKVKVGDISENIDNRRIPIKQSDRKKGSYPYYGASGIVDYIDDFIFDEPILLISEDGENLDSRKLPISYEVDNKCWVNNHAHVLSINQTSRYLVKEYFNFSDISDFITGGTRPKITKGMLTDMPIYIPKESFLVESEDKLKAIDKAIYSSDSKIASSKALQKSLINQIF